MPLFWLMHVTQYPRKRASEFLGLHESQWMVGRLKELYPALVAEVAPKPASALLQGAQNSVVGEKRRYRRSGPAGSATAEANGRYPHLSSTVFGRTIQVSISVDGTSGDGAKPSSQASRLDVLFVRTEA
jgi:hypothetical protein